MWIGDFWKCFLEFISSYTVNIILNSDVLRLSVFHSPALSDDRKNFAPLCGGRDEGNGCITDFPVRAAVLLDRSQLKCSWQFQQFGEPAPLSASQWHFCLDRVTKYHLWNEHFQSQVAVRQFEVGDCFLHETTHIMAQKRSG